MTCSWWVVVSTVPGSHGMRLGVECGWRCVKRKIWQATRHREAPSLIHGGLRYLEYYEFKLVREALIEREVLLRAAPHIVWPLRFVLPHHKALRAHWLIRLGLWIYDHLGGRELLPASYAIRFNQHETGELLQHRYRRGFVYSDCWVQDSRLVVLNVMDAAARGAVIMTRTEMVTATADDDRWVVTLRDTATGGRKNRLLSFDRERRGPMGDGYP